MIAYCYLIGWSKLDRWYYGCQWNGKANPKLLWKTYFTSSKHVKKFREENGEPDIIQIRKIFNNEEFCRIWEHKVLRRMKVIKSERWLNKSDGKCPDMESILRGARQSKNKGSEPWNKGKTGLQVAWNKGRKYNNLSFEQRSKGGLTSGQIAVRNKTGIHAWSKEQHHESSVRAKDRFLEKHKIPEFRELHSMKIRYGKLKNRFNKILRPQPHDFGFSR